MSDGSLIDAQQFGGQRKKHADGLVTTASGDPIFCGGYEHLLVFPSDTLFTADTLTAPGGCSGLFSYAPPMCGDPFHGTFRALRGMGQYDGFVSRGFVRGRSPYDFWRRPDTADCSMGRWEPCIQGWFGVFQECPDSMQSCFGYQNLRIMGISNGNCSPFSWAEEEGCDSMAYTGPDISILWSNGEQTRTTTVYSTGWVWCTVTTTNGCLSWTDSIYVTIDPMPDVPLISDELGFNFDALYTQPITSCQPCWIWCPNVPPGYTCTWYSSGGTVVNDSVWADVGGTYVVELTDPLGCTNTNVVILFLDEYIPFPNITGSVLTLFYNGDTLNMDTIPACLGSCIADSATFQVYVDGVLDTALAGLIYSYAPECPTENSYTGAFTGSAYWGVLAVTSGWVPVGLNIYIHNGPCGGSSYSLQATDSIYIQLEQVPYLLTLAPSPICPGDTLPFAVYCPTCDSVSISGPGVIGSNSLGDTAWVTEPGYYTTFGYIIGENITCTAGPFIDLILSAGCSGPHPRTVVHLSRRQRLALDTHARHALPMVRTSGSYSVRQRFALRQ